MPDDYEDVNKLHQEMAALREENADLRRRLEQATTSPSFLAGITRIQCQIGYMPEIPLAMRKNYTMWSVKLEVMRGKIKTTINCRTDEVAEFRSKHKMKYGEVWDANCQHLLMEPPDGCVANPYLVGFVRPKYQPIRPNHMIALFEPMEHPAVMLIFDGELVEFPSFIPNKGRKANWHLLEGYPWYAEWKPATSS